MAGTVVFDLDGTLVDSSGDLLAAANACFRARGLDDLLDPALDAAVAFAGGRAMLRTGLSRLPEAMPPDALNAAIEEDFPRLLEFYSADIARHSRPYPGAETMLDQLQTAGWRLSICTNKPEILAEQLLTTLGLRHYFGALIGADTLPVRKPDPLAYVESVTRTGGTVANSFLVGDTVTDHATARAAGVRIAMVGFGPEGAAIADLAPDFILDTLAALPDLAQEWLTRAPVATVL